MLTILAGFSVPRAAFRPPRPNASPEMIGAKKPAASQAHLSGEHEKGGELLMSSDIMDGLELVGPLERPRDGGTVMSISQVEVLFLEIAFGLRFLK